ncbi:MAG: type restriction endonuclease, zinc finger [Parcubacteria group bacterium]|nr:type restriction endonuclease, zinc finger [Parcubacteria group bacterium]
MFALAGIVVIALYVFIQNIGGTTATLLWNALVGFAFLATLALAWNLFKHRFKHAKGIKLMAWKYGDIQDFNQIFDLTHRQFEEFVAYLYSKKGYQYKHTGQTGDHGIDIVLEKSAQITMVQVKHYKIGNNVSEPEVRNLYGSYDHHRGVKGIIVTSSDFTPAAKEWAKGRNNLALINGSILATMIKPEDETYLNTITE